jgi:multidrug efflux pump subunit AcrA (membrane-fusion protein)/peptidoglycan hydrolase-like protein with peptidoglycan-binding domain
VRRNRLLAAVIAGVAASAAIGWIAASAVKSPAQVAADTKAPDPSAITAPVEERALATTVTARGNVRYGEPQAVSLATSTYAGQGQKSLVTKAPTKGAVLGEDAVAMEANGRPVRTLVGNVPMYRDITPGDEGQDVRQLEEALERLGYHPGKVDGKYDISTQGAVEAWYRDAGYTALGATDDQQDKLRQAHTAVSNAESAVLQAQDALDKVRKGITAKDVRQAENEVRASARDLAKAKDQVKVAEASEALARSAEDAAVLAESLARYAEGKVAADNRLATARAAADVEAAENRHDEARTSRDVAEQKLDDDTAAGASASQIESDEADVERARHAISETETGEDNAVLAQQAQAAAAEQATRQAALDTARAAQATREAQLATLQATQASVGATRDVEAAEDAGALAAANLALVTSPPDEATATAALAKAQRDLADAKAQERSLASTTGIVVPANEVLFFPTLPLRVDEAKVDRGDDATAEVMVVTTSRLAVDAAVSIPDARLVKVGDEVQITDTQLGLKATGVVTEVASKPGTDGVAANQVYVEVTPKDAPDQMTGAAVAISVAVKTTEGKVLAVPVAAVTVNGKGESRVQVLGKDGTRRTVPVTTGLAAEGYVEVRGDLHEGDRVVVGSTRA